MFCLLSTFRRNREGYAEVLSWFGLSSRNTYNGWFLLYWGSLSPGSTVVHSTRQKLIPS